ncbi:F-box/kelch-repeat protein At3g06240-like [Silene latifolia]|uniref:F-box/kelch-repeat protein At3g06240-like n=1 Tax=Silene latifolia TaxID=37657 RepID=UPI003D76DA29
MATEPSFPDEILVEILLKLPVKSILRFKTLSKHYYSLIRSQFFIRQHLALARLNDKLNYYDQSIVRPILDSIRLFNNRSSYFEELNAPPPFRTTTVGPSNFKYLISGPVDGLYCYIDPMCDTFAVWNPSTRETFILPSLSDAYNKHIAKVSFRAPLYFRRCSACGFGYDDTTDDYKVVLIHKFKNINKYKLFSIFTFSVSKCEWRKTEESFGLDNSNIKSHIGVFVRGACHWLYEPSSNLGYSILAFDMSTELHRIIAFPTVGDEHAWSDVCIVTFNGFLGLVNAQEVDCTLHWTGVSPSFDVWVMDEYSVTESWTIFYRVSLEPGIVGRFLGIVKNRVYVGEYERHLVSYDLDSKDKKCYINILDRLNRGYLDYFVPYEESLVRIIKQD